MAIIDSYLSYLVEVEGTDLLLAAGARPLMRVKGQLQVMKRRLVAASDVEYHALEVLGNDRLSRLPDIKNIDFVYETPINGSERRFRGSVYYQRNGLNIILRSIPDRPRTFQELGLPAVTTSFTDLGSGLVLVVGPARSGKTATLAAMVHQMNEQKSVHIVTIEDPIELVHRERRALISQRQVGLHAESMDSALDGALKEDPDVVVVSDVREAGTVQRVLRAAEMGLLVLAATESTSAVRAVQKLVDLCPKDEQQGIRYLVGRFLKGVIALQTVPRADGSGPVLATEILTSTPKMSQAIRAGNMSEVIEIMRKGQQGMRLMEDELSSLSMDGRIAKEEAQARIEVCEMGRVGGG